MGGLGDGAIGLGVANSKIVVPVRHLAQVIGLKESFDPAAAHVAGSRRGGRDDGIGSARHEPLYKALSDSVRGDQGASEHQSLIEEDSGEQNKTIFSKMMKTSEPSERFEQTARELEFDEGGDAFERAVTEITALATRNRRN